MLDVLHAILARSNDMIFYLADVDSFEGVNT
jgi:hypothetical protein